MISPVLSTFVLLTLSISSVKGLTAKRSLCPDGINSAVNQACCALYPVVQDLKDNLFDNECGDSAHGALRIAFHDAIGISPTLGGGGADGSIATFNATELLFPENSGIDDIFNDIKDTLVKHENVLTPGDFIQLAAAVSLVQCPGGPRVPFRMGRAPPVAPAPENLVPVPTDNVTHILQRFGEVGFSPAEVVVLVGGSHSVAGVDDIVPMHKGLPMDTTPAVFDTQIFVDVLLHGTNFSEEQGPQSGEAETAIDGTVRLQSDGLLARDPRTACFWQSFVNEQAKLTQSFGEAFFKISLLGHDENKLVDCSEVIPKAIPAVKTPATFPPTKHLKDIDHSCATAAFPNLATQPGPATSVPPIPQADED